MILGQHEKHILCIKVMQLFLMRFRYAVFSSDRIAIELRDLIKRHTGSELKSTIFIISISDEQTRTDLEG